MIEKENFHVITGGPGAGKSSLLESLALKGYHFIPETARQIIKERIASGLSPRPDPATFAQSIFDKDLANFISNSDLASTIFFDRSMLDSAWQIFNADKPAYNHIENVLLQYRYSKNVFIAPPWKEIYINDSERDHTFEESIEIYQALKEWYTQHQYEIVVLPKSTIEERVTFILKNLMHAQ